LSLNPFIHKGIVCGTFGSFGWSGEGTKNIQQRFTQVRVKTPLEPLNCRFKPGKDTLAECEAWGEKFVAALKA